MNPNTFFLIASMVYLQDVQLDVWFEFVLFFKKKVYFLIWNETGSFLFFFMLLYFYCKWLLSFSNEHTSVAEKLWLPGRKKKKSWTSKQSRLSPIACLPRQWRADSSKAAGFFPLHLPLHPSFWEIPRHSLNQQLCPPDALLARFLADETI